MKKNKYYSIINIVGLAFGIAASVLIFIWIGHELSYDKFHEDYKNIYRLSTDASLGGQTFNFCFVPSPFAERIAEKCPEVEKSTRISPYFDIVFRYNNTYYKEKKAIIADSNFFNLFSFNLIEGNPRKPFVNKQSVILTKSLASKYFGTERALGKMLEIDGQNPLTVSAVIDDIPANSHMKFSMVLFLDNEPQWDNFNRITYIKLNKNFSKENVKNVIDEIVDNDMVKLMSGSFGTTPEQFRNAGNYVHVNMQSLASIHLNPVGYGELEAAGNKIYVIFFTIIAILILFIAGINYMNLSTAYYDTRLTEVGIRKTNGASSGKLIMQFLTETSIINFGAFILGLIIIELSLPLFQNFLGIQINDGISNSWYFSLIILLLILMLGTISGIYPAFKIARHKTLSIIKGKLDAPFKASFNTRSVLVVFQFVITIIVIVSTLLVQKQVKFLLNKDLGFKKDQLVVIEGANNLTDDKKELLKEELKTNPDISNVTYSDTYPGQSYSNITSYNIEGDALGNQFVLKTINTDYDYFNTYGMNIISGRGFNETDNEAVILNESAVRLMNLNNPEENKIINNNASYSILGVVRDFNHDPLTINLDPIIIRLNKNQGLDYITVRLSKADVKKTISFLNEKWNEISGNKPFEYHFLNDQLRSAYNTEMKAGKIFSMFSILSVIIACMGILGIASFLIQRRIKEIGIRKANGAKTSELTFMFLKDFVTWVIVAYIIACPFAWFAMHKWLQNFSYKTNMSWWVFILAGVFALTIALLTIFWQSWNAARKNPVEALRYE